MSVFPTYDSGYNNLSMARIFDKDIFGTRSAGDSGTRGCTMGGLVEEFECKGISQQVMYVGINEEKGSVLAFSS